MHIVLIIQVYLFFSGRLGISFFDIVCWAYEKSNANMFNIKQQFS